LMWGLGEVGIAPRSQRRGRRFKELMRRAKPLVRELKEVLD